jgi:hypothetical protein
MKKTAPHKKGGTDSDRHVLFIGANGRALDLVQTLPMSGASSCVIEGFLDDDPARREVLETHGVPYLGGLAELERVLVERVVDCVYVCLPIRSSYDAAKEVVQLCERCGVPVRMAANLLELPLGSGTMWQMGSVPVMTLEAQPQEDGSASVQSGKWRAYARLTALLLPFTILSSAFGFREFRL